MIPFPVFENETSALNISFVVFANKKFPEPVFVNVALPLKVFTP